MLNRIGRFIKKVRSRKGYTLVEAATVVAITGAMAIVAVPIASDKIEDGKIATAGGTTQAIATSMVKFFGDTANFPIASGEASSVVNGVIDSTKKIKVLRSGLGANATLETTNNLDPDLATISTSGLSGSTTPTLVAADAFNANLKLWTPGDSGGGPELKGELGANVKKINMNEHLVTDAIGYGNNGLNWLGPYIPSIDQDPWGRNYLAYVRAVDFDSFGLTAAGGNVKVPKVTPGTAGNTDRIFCWIISAGPDEKLQTAPTDSILKGDDIGTILALPAIVTGTNDKGQESGR